MKTQQAKFSKRWKKSSPIHKKKWQQWYMVIFCFLYSFIKEFEQKVTFVQHSNEKFDRFFYTAVLSCRVSVQTLNGKKQTENDSPTCKIFLLISWINMGEILAPSIICLNQRKRYQQDPFVHLRLKGINRRGDLFSKVTCDIWRFFSQSVLWPVENWVSTLL